jgi:hypothetical protein
MLKHDLLLLHFTTSWQSPLNFKNNLHRLYNLINFLSIYIKQICEFKDIIVFKDFEVENGMLGLERDIYLSIIKFVD